MPTALIDKAITAQKFELVRDKIGELLFVELANQYTLNGNEEALKAGVWVERFIPFDHGEGMNVNVCLGTGDFDNKTRSQVDGNYLYYIDFYANAKATNSVDGDKKSALKLQRLMGVARAILSDPKYRNIGETPPYLCEIMVKGFAIEEINTAKKTDASYGIRGRMTLAVRVPETVQLKDDAPQVSTHVTRAFLGETDKGYRYVWSHQMQITMAADGDSFTLPIAYTGLIVEVVSDKYQSYVDAWTQDGDDIQMTNGALFPAGAVINLQLKVNDYFATITIAEDGNSFTLPAAYEGVPIAAIFDQTQAYSEGFTQDGDEIQMTNGVTYYAGQRIKIWYGLQLVQATVEEDGNRYILPAEYRNFEQVMVIDGNQPISAGINPPKVITEVDDVTFTAGSTPLIAVR